MEHVQSPFLLTAWVSSCLNGLKLRGWNTAHLFHAASIDPELLQQPTFPADAFNRLLETAAELYDAPDVGIESRRGITPGSLLSVSLAVMSCANLREGLSLMVKFNAGLTNCYDIFLAEGDARTSFGLRLAREATEPYPLICDAVLATTIKTCRFIQPGPMRIAGVEMARPRPPHAEVYANYFKAPITWNARHTVIHFDSAYLDRPSIHANQSLLEENDRQAMALFQSKPGRSVTEELMAYLDESQEGQQMSLESAARHLGMGGRSLQRELHAQGATYCQLLENVRKLKAQRLLANSSESVTQIALALGFRDTGNFCRAFKRWFDCTPNTYRRQRQDQK